MNALSRNDPCPCGSGEKYKKCCMGKASTPLAAGPSPAQLFPAALQHHQAGRLPQAEALYRQVLRSNPDNPDVLYMLGMLIHQTGNNEAAAEIVSRALKANPANPAFHNLLGSIYSAQKKLGDAVSCYRKALALKPDDADVYYNMGNALCDEGRDEEAAASYRKVIELKPDHAYAYYNLGDIYKRRGELENARLCYEKARAVRPDFAEAHHNLGAVLKEQGDTHQAIACYQRAIELKPDYVKAYCNMGLALIELGQYGQAQQFFEAAFRIQPDHPEVHSGAAELLLESGKLQEAEQAAGKALALGHDKPEVYTQLGRIYAKMGNDEQAAQSYERALELDAGNFGALLGRGDLYSEMGDFRHAEACFLRVLESEAPLQRLAARCHLAHVGKVQAGDENMAALLAAAEDLDSLSPEMATNLHYALGKSYDDTGNYEKAMEHFRQGGALKREKLDYDPAVNEQKIDTLIETFDHAFIERLKGGGDLSPVPVFVLGMPRSGTTLTEQIIASHPGVFGAGELKDLMRVASRQTAGDAFFPDNLKALTPQLLASWGADYVDGLKKRSPESLRITDKMPGNYLLVGLIHLMLPNAKIIHVSRNPIDTCLSCFTKKFTHGHEYSFELSELGRHYAGYARLMKHWREVLPEGAFLDVHYEELVADTETQARRLIEYCGLEWNDACLEFYRNKRSVRTASVTQVRQPIYKSSVERWRNYEKFIAPLLKELEELI